MAVVIVLALYFVPTIVAISRKMPNVGAIIVINLFLGWSLIGWVVALAMSLGDPSPRGGNVIVQNNLTSFAPTAPGAHGGPTWDHARQAFIYLDPVSHVWQVQRGDGTWAPITTAPAAPAAFPAPVIAPPTATS